MRRRNFEKRKRVFKEPEEFYKEAIRYLQNAKNILKDVPVEHDRYKLVNIWHITVR
jgi:hypothetical protein